MTIEVPTPSAELLTQLETATIETDQTEVAAIAALREKFAPYAKHNGFICTADYDMQTSNYRVDRKAFYQIDGKRVRGLLALDGFDTTHSDQNRGSREGTRVYLTEQGTWLELERVGHWTQWQGEAQWWYTTADSRREIEVGYEDDDNPDCGVIRMLTDAEFAGKYNVDEVLEQIGKTMAEMCKKLPERYGKLKARAELAQRTVEALKS